MFVARQGVNTYVAAAVPGQSARLGVEPRGCASNLKVISGDCLCKGQLVVAMRITRGKVVGRNTVLAPALG
jgi:hypothetical protein